MPETPVVDVVTTDATGSSTEQVAVADLPERKLVHVNLREQICINGQPQGPGLAWVPENAFAVWGNSVLPMPEE